MILKVAGKRYLQRLHFRHPNSSEKVPYWECLWHIEICKNRRKNLYFCFAAPVGKLSFAFCALSPTFWKFFQIFAWFLASFSEKAFPVVRSHITQIRIASNICRIRLKYVMVIPSSCSRPFRIACFFSESAALCRNTNRKLQGGGVPSPEGLQ